LRLDIGPLSAGSQVSEPVPFPDDRLPGGDLEIDVVVSSSCFRVGREPETAPTASSAEDSFLLPGDGGPARAPDGGSTLTFVLHAPAQPGPAMARITYYFRGAVVQSHLLSAQIRDETTTDKGEPWSIATDYTVAAVLATAAAIPDRPRLAVILNGNGTDHQIYLRTRGTDSEKSLSAAADLPPAIGDATRDFREALASPAVAPTAINQSKAQLVTALRTLAPLGWDMYSALFGVIPDVLLGLGDGTTSVVLHVARPAGVTLSVPWALVYSIPLYQQPIEQVPLCPLIAKWDGRSALVSGQAMSCPESGAVPHTSDLLCPFGFLGFRLDIEQLNSTKDPVLSITASPGSRVVVAETTYQVNKKQLQDHITDITNTVARLNGVGTDEAKDKTTLKPLISRDLPLVYFFCHGDRPDLDRPETYLGIGNNEHVSPQDLVGWIQEAFFTRQLRLWNQVRPLVFINACHSAEIDPKSLFSYINVFVGGGNAAGVIGTEVKVSQPLAMEFAKTFFDQLLTPGGTVATALRYARLEFLAKGNLFGLNYTPYCWADLTIVP
jgi:CHAT domain